MIFWWNYKQLSEKVYQLQREAVRAQIDLDTLSLNKIESIRDSHRREAMKELEEWRLSVEEPMFEGIEGKKQENRKAFRYKTLSISNFSNIYLKMLMLIF